MVMAFDKGSQKSLPRKFRDKLEHCLTKFIPETFSEHEMKVLFIQPAGMDTGYYNEKIKELLLRSLGCAKEKKE